MCFARQYPEIESVVLDSLCTVERVICGHSDMKHDLQLLRSEQSLLERFAGKIVLALGNNKN
jgi:hypothetical protein